MTEQLFVRELTAAERRELEAGLKRTEAFVLRRCQTVLAGGRGEGVGPVAGAVGCSRRTVRDVIHGFNARGVASPVRGPHRPKSAEPELDDDERKGLEGSPHHGPRTFANPPACGRRKGRPEWPTGRA